MSQEIKKKAIAYFEANLLDGDKINDCGKAQIVIDEDFIEVFSECLDLALEQRDKEIMEIIEEWKPIQWSEQSLSKMKDDIINLISNSKK